MISSYKKMHLKKCLVIITLENFYKYQNFSAIFICPNLSLLLLPHRLLQPTLLFFLRGNRIAFPLLERVSVDACGIWPMLHAGLGWQVHVHPCDEQFSLPGSGSLLHPSVNLHLLRYRASALPSSLHRRDRSSLIRGYYSG